MTSADTVRIFVGADDSQKLALRVLEYSIRKRTSLNVEVTPMIDLGLPEPRDPRMRARTGFSFSRFAIPELAGHQGRAIYLDADMLVLTDIAELWNWPLGDAHVLCQGDLRSDETTPPDASGKHRRKQCSVMLLDCGKLRWDAPAIIAGLGPRYTYEELLYELCIVDEAHVSYDLPFRWNSLERLSDETSLIHYTEMPTQPWVYAANPNGWIWVDELRAMLADGQLPLDRIRQDVDAGFARPSLLEELREPGGAPVTPEASERYNNIDTAAGFEPHATLVNQLSSRNSTLPFRLGRSARQALRKLIRPGH